MFGLMTGARIRAGMVVAVGTLALAACSEAKNHYVLASTGTVIGVDLSLNPANMTPQGRLGYHRGEIAIVPTDRRNCIISDSGAFGGLFGGNDDSEIKCESDASGSAAASPNVLMEIHYGEIFSSNSSIYQRLAVGDIAVRQPGASVMFARSADGKTDDSATAAVTAATQNYIASTTEVERAQALQVAEETARVQRSKIEVIFHAVRSTENSTNIDSEKWNALIENASSSPNVRNVENRLRRVETRTEMATTLVGFGNPVIDPLLAAAVASN